jgi:hypothetical protein
VDFPSLSSLTVPHLSVPQLNDVSWLPSPIKLGLWGTGLAIAAGLSAFFLHSVRLALYLGVTAGVLLFSAAVATGYEKMGEDKIIPQLQKVTAELQQAYDRAAQFQADAVAAQARATASDAARRKALAELKATLEERISAQADAVRNAAVADVVVRDLNAAIASFNSTAPVARAVEGAATAATVAAGVTVEGWERWSGEAIRLYGECASQVRGLQDAYNGLVESSKINDQLRR